MFDHHQDVSSLDQASTSEALVEPVVAGLLKLPGIPDSWQFYALSLGAMLALAGLDFIGVVFAKEWAERHHAGFYLAGLVTFVLLFVVFAASLRVAELTVVTLGWIIFLQIGVVLLDTLRYGLYLPPGKWAAIGVMLALQGYLILAPNGSSS